LNNPCWRCELLVSCGDVDAVVNALSIVDTSVISMIPGEEVSVRTLLSVDVAHRIHLMYIIVIIIENILPFLVVILFEVISQ